jgi:hypothetical protein
VFDFAYCSHLYNISYYVTRHALTRAALYNRTMTHDDNSWAAVTSRKIREMQAKLDAEGHTIPSLGQATVDALNRIHLHKPECTKSEIKSDGTCATCGNHIF